MTTRSFASLRTMLPILFGIVLFGLGIYALNHLMHSVDPATVMAQIRSTPANALALAIAATVVGYAALVGYDALALQFIGKTLPARIIAMGGLLGYALGNTIGVSVISGGAIRYRIYSAFGLDAFEVATISGYIAAALGTGLTLIGLAALSLHPTAVSQVITLRTVRSCIPEPLSHRPGSPRRAHSGLCKHSGAGGRASGCHRSDALSA